MNTDDLKQQIKDAGITISFVAKRLGKPRQTINNYFVGRAKMPEGIHKEIKKIIKKFK